MPEGDVTDVTEPAQPATFDDLLDAARTTRCPRWADAAAHASSATHPPLRPAAPIGPPPPRRPTMKRSPARRQRESPAVILDRRPQRSTVPTTPGRSHTMTVADDRHPPTDRQRARCVRRPPRPHPAPAGPRRRRVATRRVRGLQHGTQRHQTAELAAADADGAIDAATEGGPRHPEARPRQRTAHRQARHVLAHHRASGCRHTWGKTEIVEQTLSGHFGKVE